MLFFAPVSAQQVVRDAEKPGTRLADGRIEALSPPECDGKRFGGEVVSECAPDSPSEETVDRLKVRRERGLKRLGVLERGPYWSGDVLPGLLAPCCVLV